MLDVFGVDDDLHDPGHVAQVEEHHPAVVAAAGHPAAQRDVLAEIVDAEVTGAVGTHRRRAHGVAPSVSVRIRSQPAIWSRGTSTWSPVPMSFTATTPRLASSGATRTP